MLHQIVLGLFGRWSVALLLFIALSLFLLFLLLTGTFRVFLGRNKCLCTLPLFLLLFRLLLLQSVLFFGSLLCLFRQEVLSTFNLKVNLALLLWWGEWSVEFVGLVDHFERNMSLVQISLLELGKESVPAFTHQGWIFGQLPLDHELLDVVYGVDVVHAVFNDSSHLFQTFVSTHGADSVSLHEDVGAGKKFEGLERGTVGSK